MKNKFILLSSIALITACTQREVDITYKGSKINTYKPNYLRGNYVKDEKHGIVRDLRLENNNYKETNTTDVKNTIFEEEKIEDKKKVKEEIQKNNTAANKQISEVIVEKGDSLLKYQREYGISVEEIAKLNNIKKPYNIYIGQKLKINRSNNLNVEPKNNFDDQKFKTIIVEQGHSLLGISLKYNTTVRDLASINNLKAPYNIYAGQKLKVPDIKEKNLNNEKENFYIVESGDSLLLIAKKTNTKFNDLIKINNIKKPYDVFVGQKIFLFEKNNKIADANKNTGKETKKQSIENKNDNNKRISLAEENRTVISSIDNNIFIWPTEGEVIKKFGDENEGKLYDGIAIKAVNGSQIKAVDDGEIAYVGNELKDLGNIIIIKHKNNWLSIYGHCNTTNVKIKNTVKKGDIIAKVGKTGIADDYQLYFALRRGKVAVDPIKYLQ